MATINTDDVAIGRRIQEYRERAGFPSRTELASLLGITESYLRNLESGRQRLPDKQLPRFARALGCTSEELLGLETDFYYESAGICTYAYTDDPKTSRDPEKLLKAFLSTIKSAFAAGTDGKTKSELLNSVARLAERQAPLNGEPPERPGQDYQTWGNDEILF